MLVVYIPPRDVHCLKRWLDAAAGAMPLCLNQEEMRPLVEVQRYAWLMNVFSDQ